jgi:hypothetical protein
MRAAPLLLPLSALLFLGMAKKPTVTVRFHIEANARDGEPFATPVKFRNPPREGFIERVPTLSERDIHAIFPVPAADGSFGCAFQFNKHGTFSLQTLSTQQRGRSLMVFVATKAGMHQVIDMIIDQPVKDGIIYVPTGLTAQEIAMLEKQFPRMGEQKGKKRS